MDLYALVSAVTLIARIYEWVVIASVILSYFLSPYHPVREALDRIVEPVLGPIRRVMPQTGMIDFSPMVLILLIEVLRLILIQLVSR